MRFRICTGITLVLGLKVLIGQGPYLISCSVSPHDSNWYSYHVQTEEYNQADSKGDTLEAYNNPEIVAKMRIIYHGIKSSEGSNSICDND